MSRTGGIGVGMCLEVLDGYVSNIRVKTGGIAVGMCLILELGLEVLLWVCV